MAGLLQATGVGYLVRDPYYTDVKKDGTKLERPFSKFRILHEPYVGANNTAETIAIDVTVNGPMANTVRDYAKKGTKVLVMGPVKKVEVAMKDGQVVKANTGKIIVNFEMEAREFQLLDSKPANGEASNGARQAVAAGGGNEVVEDDAPF